jgi:hypothetical protein
MHDDALVTNAADPRRVNYGRRKAHRREENYLAALRSVLGTVGGRLAFAHLLERAGLWESTFHADALTMAFSEGRRAMGLRLLEDLVNAAPTLYDTLEAERRARHEADRREAQAVNTNAEEV